MMRRTASWVPSLALFIGAALIPFGFTPSPRLVAFCALAALAMAAAPPESRS